MNDLIPSACLTVDASGIVCAENRAAAALLGRGKEELKGRRLADLLSGDSARVLDAFLRRVFRGKARQSCTLAATDQGGQPRLLRMDGAACGECGLCVAVAMQVTEQPQPGDPLRESESRLQLALDASRMGVWEWDLLSNRVFWSPQCSAVIGVEDFDGALDSFTRLVHPDDVQNLAAQFDRATADRSRFSSEFRILLADGSLRWLSNLAQAIYDDAGRPLRVVGTVQDVTARKQSEAVLAEDAVRQCILFEQSRDGIVVLDACGKVFDLNRSFADMLGYAVDEVRELHVWDWDVQWTRQELLDRLRTPGPDGTFETRHRRRDGGTYDAEIACSRADWHGQDLLFCVCRDVTRRKQAEAALQERNEVFRAIVSQAIDGIVLIDAETLAIAEFNDAACNSLGYSREEFGKLTLNDIQGSLTPDEVALRVHHLCAQGGGSFQNKQRCKSGEMKDALISNQVINIHGRSYLVGIWHDITERLRIEQTLRESEARFSTVFRSSPAGISISTLHDGRIIDANASLSRMFGYQREEAIGRTAAELQIWVHPEARTDMVARLRELGRVTNLEIEARRKCGDIGNFLVSVELIRLEGQECVLTMVSDITERARISASLQASEERYRRIVSTAIEGIWVMDENYATTFVNARTAEMLGYAPAEMTGRQFEEFLWDEDLPDHARHVEARRQGRGERYERRLRRRDGSELWTLVSAVPLLDADKRFLGSFAMFVDITDRRNAEEALRRLGDSLEQEVALRTAELREANASLQRAAAQRERLETELLERKQELERFGRLDLVNGIASGLAHELNQPIAAAQYLLAGALRMAEDGSLDRAATINVLADAYSQLRRLGKTVGRVTALSRHRRTLASNLDMARMCDEAVEFLDFEFRKRGIAVVSHVPRGLPAIRADRIHVQQLLLNLLHNALEAIRSGAGAQGRISLDTRLHPGTLEVLVRDNGAGFSPEALENLARPFFTTKENGTGLGLSICQRILETYGGSIAAENNVDGGATVRICLPLAPSA